MKDALGEHYQVMLLLAQKGDLLDRLLTIDSATSCVGLIKEAATNFEVPEYIIELG